MSKPSRKLSLRKETLRQLGADELAHVGGGTIEWVVLKQPSKTSGPTGTDPSLNYYNFNYNLYYWY